MFDKMPPDFNPDAYAAAYPDVALSGLGAREHYVRFGRLLGRSPSGKPREGRAKAMPELVAAAPAAPTSAMAEASPLPSSAAKATRVRPPACQAIVARPDDFNANEVVPLPAPAKAPRGATETLALEDFMLSLGDGGSAKPLRAYARMVGIADPCDNEAAGALPPGDEWFESGACRIENAWFADRSTLRLMIAGGLDDGASLAGWAVRAFQALPATPGKLSATGKGIQLPEQGPCFVDLELLHPLMPLLLELADPEGTTRALALLPFPSLLPGGLHWGEAKALQRTSNPIDSFWSLSDQFLQELIGAGEAPARSIVEYVAEAGPAGDLMSSPEVRDWLALVFGLGIDGASPSASGLRLVLPYDAVPTIAALVSRRLEDSAGCAGPFVVAMADTRRPLGSVALSPRFEPGPGAPRLEGRAPARRKPPAGRASGHLAIVYRHPRNIDLSASERPERSTMPPLTIMLDASDAGRTEAVVRRLKDMRDATGLDLWVRSDGGKEIRATLDHLCGAGQWQPLHPRAGLRQVAREARHDVLLTVDDRVRLGDDTIQRLLAMLETSGGTASVSCLLLAEKVIKKQIVLQPGSGGIFPSGVSFLGAPSMAFAEPDVSDVLRDLTYPVVANTFCLTAWRREPLAGLPDPTGPVPRDFEDIAIGLDLARSGHRNLCTTLFSVSIAGDHVRRDAIDPLGTAVIQPGQWQDLLDGVTIVRELF